MKGPDRYYQTLVGTDIYRDGGSLEARFLLANGKSETLWLQAAPDSVRDHQIVHSSLFVYPDLERTAPPVRIEPNSSEEDRIRNAIEVFLADPDVSISSSSSYSTPEYYLGRLRELALAIPIRTNEDEAMNG